MMMMSRCDDDDITVPDWTPAIKSLAAQREAAPKLSIDADGNIDAGPVPAASRPWWRRWEDRIVAGDGDRATVGDRRMMRDCAAWCAAVVVTCAALARIGDALWQAAGGL